jgi:hypothetical protein
MEIQKDFKELLEFLSSHRVEFIGILQAIFCHKFCSKIHVQQPLNIANLTGELTCGFHHYFGGGFNSQA